MSTTQRNQGFKILVATATILILFSFVTWLVSYLSGFKYHADLGMAISGLCLAYLLVSWRFWEPIQADEMAVRDILGKPYDRVDAGPPFAPLGFVNILLYPTATTQREFPGEPRQVHYPKEGESDTPPEGSGLVPPLRITFASSPLKQADARQLFGDNFEFTLKGQTYKFADDTTMKDDGLSNARVTAVVSHICRFRIYDPVRFTIAVPPNSETGSRIDEAFRQIEDEQVVALTTILTQMTVAQAIKNIAWINAVLFRKVCVRIGAVNESGLVDDTGHSSEWGIDLEGTAVKPFEFNRKLNSAITGVAQAAFDAATTLRTAEAAKQAGILAGQATASAARDLEQATLEGRAAGLSRIGEVMKTEEGRAAQGAEVARAVADGGNTIVVGTSGITDIIGLAAAAAKATKKKE
jgi:regulator of protease activity HflC (stomatin/prohibitin superfamily)